MSTIKQRVLEILLKRAVSYDYPFDFKLDYEQSNGPNTDYPHHIDDH